MTAFDELWSRTAAAEYDSLDTARRDQVSALVREILRHPYGVGVPQDPDGPARDRIAATGDVTVHYQVDDLGEMVYFVRVVWRG